MNTQYQDQNNDLINLINVLSFVIGYSNLQENKRFGWKGEDIEYPEWVEECDFL